MGKAIDTTASWIGKAAYELGILTGQDGAWCFRRAKAFADDLEWQGVPLATHEPRATMRWLYGVNDNAATPARSTPPTTFAGIPLDDIDVDISGRGGFTLDVITSHQQSLGRPTRITIPHSLAQGLRDGLAGKEWSIWGKALVRASNDLIIVSLAKRPAVTTVALILTRDEARELGDLLAGSAGRPHWSRFTARGFWHDDLPNLQAA